MLMNDTPFGDIPAQGKTDAESHSEWEEALHPAATAAPEMAMLLVSGRQPPSLAQANNNSFCHAIQSSPRHAHLCEPYCGQAFYQTLGADGATSYRCHAGLHCFAVKLKRQTGRQLAVIGGRAFTEGSDYYVLEKRVQEGDLRDLASAKLFSNIPFTTALELETASERVEAALNHDGDKTFSTHPPKAPLASTNGNGKAASIAPQEVFAVDGKQNALSDVPKLLLPPVMSLKKAAALVLKSLSEAHSIGSALLALYLDGSYVNIGATGEMATNAPLLDFNPKDTKFLRAAEQGKWVSIPKVLKNAPIGAPPGASVKTKTGVSSLASANLYPLTIGGEVRGVLVVADEEFGKAKQDVLAQFCREIVTPLEVLRLREELERRTRVTRHLQKFVEQVRGGTPDEAYKAILTHSTELVHSERGSLLLYDEVAEDLAVMAATGPRVEAMRSARVRLGDGVAGTVFQSGHPLIVTNLATCSDCAPAPLERSYKTASFISYPIIIGGTRVGVLNVTDKSNGEVYDELDLNLLQMITPQLALALDAAGWQQKATRFQLLSITDPLTDLLNRRYLEERLTEETERSKRHRYPMCFMMVDIDDFKIYNDLNGHQAGDLALEMTAQNLKSALRSADVAARYGGEEFSVLLPQTMLEEAHIIAERIRRRVERTLYPHGAGQPLGAVTVSIGISTFTPDTDSPASIINAADQALYTAKRLGKNRVEPHPLV